MDQSYVNDRLAETYLGVLNDFDNRYASSGAMNRGALVDDFTRNVWPAVAKAHSWSAQMTTQVATECCASFPSAGANVLWVFLDLNERIRWFELAQEAIARVKASDRKIMSDDRLFSTELNTLANLAIVYSDAARHRPAIRCRFKALRLIDTIREEQRRVDRHANIVSNLAVNLNGLQKYRSALVCANYALEELDKAGISEGLLHANTHTNRGLSYKGIFLGDRERAAHDQAKAEYERALAIGVRLGGVQVVTDSYGNLGDLCRRDGQPGDALAFHRLQLENANAGAKRWSVNNARRAIGEDLVDLGRIEEAMLVLEEARKGFLEDGETNGAAEIDELLAALKQYGRLD